MKRICAWCQKELGEDGNGEKRNPVSHGICPDCARDVLSHKAQTMSDFLDKFPEPVYLLNSVCEIISANKEGAAALGKELSEFAGEVAGRAFDCKFAGLKGGCGGSIHCRTCTIRNSITKTYETGKSILKVPAYPDLHGVTGENAVEYLVSTEKVGGAVIVKVEKVL